MKRIRDTQKSQLKYIRKAILNEMYIKFIFTFSYIFPEDTSIMINWNKVIEVFILDILFSNFDGRQK